MVNLGLKEGRHMEEQPEEQLTEDQLMLIQETLSMSNEGDL